MSVLERKQEVESRIAAVCRQTGRQENEIKIIAVTKYVSLETTEQVLHTGLLHIGENRWQDVKPKWEALHEQGTWHFLGHLQTNKVKDVIGKFAYIHSLDRMSLAKELDKQAAALGIKVNCFLQVNISGEESKYGVSPQEFFVFAEEVSKLEHIHVCGLMTMAPYELEAEETRPVFRGLRELRDRLNERSLFPYEVKELSMGMSGDFEVAIEEGATWVRLGTVLVGKES
ncbi:YggS family pyridoxal phosphate enzyme [Paenibacillus pectinilyticus]|uniref:Pyridoxal phosphate homeostasis protein n=1 Tax=Paenibacillus pectinilyticus TaxID=512399 RepID=A0A1C1A8Z1_9BACL|nr:YggS family pyridoxal phosphate-dependent enzyme [Paenibacillus pectinilyticus]OCT17086.1 YggS family pyridoxal phosphate enzyme [Paenibacillus pectinilyticus]